MIALPVKSNTPQSAIAPLFGKAKWFALVDAKGSVTFWRNEEQSGRHVVDAFKSMGVKRVVFQDMGANPFMKLFQAGIACFHAGKGRVTLETALSDLERNALVAITADNMGAYVEQGHRHHGGSHQEGHAHHH